VKLDSSLQNFLRKLSTDECSITLFWISSSKSKRRQMHCNMIACRRNRVVDFLSPGHNANSIALHEYPTMGTSREKRRNFSASSSPLKRALMRLRVSYLSLSENGVSWNRPEINAIYHVSCCADEETIRCLPTWLQHIEVSITSSACSRDPAPIKQIKEMQ
jgi:hypothetical protein